LSQNTIVKRTLSQHNPVFPLSIRGVKEVFPGFALGDFAVLQGLSVLSLASLLCVKAQLPLQLGGLQSSVVFVDGCNTFGLYQIAQLAQVHHLNPKKVLDNIYISRAFTTYQTAALIKDQLRETIKKYNAKLVIISDIAGFFLDKDVAEDVTQRMLPFFLVVEPSTSREGSFSSIRLGLTKQYPSKKKKKEGSLCFCFFRVVF
jgi:hypothetical protein